jgi:DNA ligase (NAD+)
VWPEATVIEASAEDLPLDGEIMVITGKFSSASREEISAALQALGAKVTGSVSKNTTALVCGESAGSKLTKATSLGIRIIDEAELDTLLTQG